MLQEEAYKALGGPQQQQAQDPAYRRHASKAGRLTSLPQKWALKTLQVMLHTGGLNRQRSMEDMNRSKVRNTEERSDVKLLSKIQFKCGPEVL